MTAAGTAATATDDAIEPVVELANRIVTTEVTPARLAEIEAQDVRFDDRLWATLGAAGLLGLELPPPNGSGLGFVPGCVVAEAVARGVAHVPYLVSALMAGPIIAAAGNAEPSVRWVDRLADGSAVVTVALVDPPRRDGEPVGVVASADGAGWRLDGTKTCVPYAQVAHAVLVPARLPTGECSVFLVELPDDAVTVTSLQTTSGVPEASLRFDGCRVTTTDAVGGATVVADLVQRGAVGTCVMTAGLCAAALELTVDHVSERQQFGRRLASFQAVAHRAADAFVDALAIRLTAWSAAEAIERGEDARAAVAIAKHWAAEGGNRVLHAATHLHGGIGVDREHPLHRYFVWARHLELTFGGSSEHLARLGRLLVPEAVA